jgi:hypothetical protein
MACSLATVQADACTSGIGKETNPITLLQVTAQNALAWAEANNSGVDYSLAAIQARACASGIGKVTNRLQLYRIIAQNVCSTIT